MRVFHGIENVTPPLDGSVLSIGNFDGVHRGHQQLIAQAGLFAANTGGAVVVLTFDPHPLSILAPDRAPKRLSRIPDRLKLLERAGADVAVVVQTDRELLAVEPEDFVERIVVERFRPTHIVEGPSFTFGKARRGTPELLKQLGPRFGFSAHILAPVEVQIDAGESIMVSSSVVRKLLEEGKTKRASLCLGRDYELSGTVIEGAKRGRSIGFPTANIDVPDLLIPADGVYAARATTQAGEFAAAVSIGSNPTFEGQRRIVEAHLLEFDGDLYGQSVTISFGRRVRGQVKFDRAEQLAAQIAEDVAAVRLAASDQIAG